MHRRKTVYTFALVALVAAVVAGTLMMAFMRPPEELTADVGEGDVRVTALIRGGGTMKLNAGDLTPDESTALKSPVYQVVYQGDGLTGPANIRVMRGVDWMGEWPPEELQLLVRDASIGAWRTLSTDIDVRAGVVRAQLPVRFFQGKVARFGFGVADLDAKLPEQTPVIVEELRAFPPPKAVGYRAFASYADVNQDFVLLTEPLEYGGCDGRFRSGDDATLTSQDIEIDGRVYRIGMIWELKNGGCVDGETISVYRSFMEAE